MKRFIIEQSSEEFCTSYSGLALVGLCMNKFSQLGKVTHRRMGNSNNVISDADILGGYLGLLSIGKSDYEAITTMHDDEYFKNFLGIANIPSAKRLRQRRDKHATNYLAIVEQVREKLHQDVFEADHKGFPRTFWYPNHMVLAFPL